MNPAAGRDARVTIFLPSLAGGGAERSLCVIANGLASRGASVTLALARAEGPFLADVDPRVGVKDLRADSVWRALPALVKHLRREHPTAMLSAMSHANIVAAIAHRLARSNARLVLSERAHFTSVMSEFPGVKMRLTRSLMRITYPWADHVVTVSDGVGEDLQRHAPVPPERLLTIANPVVDSRLIRLAQEQPSHPWLSRGDTPVILAAGRLIAQKDFTTLLEAFRLVRSQRPARLMILGEGELRGQLLGLANELGVASDVALPGFEPNPFSAMRAAAVFVLSSRFEGLPGVLIQAMACGTAVVSTDCPSGPREVLEGGRWGRLVPVGDAASMAAAILAAMDDPRPDVRARVGDFSEQRAVARYADVLGLSAALR